MQNAINDSTIDIDDIPVNPTHNTHLNEVIASRRSLLKGGLGLALGSFVSTAFSGCAVQQNQPSSVQASVAGTIGFTSVPVQTATDFDQVIVPEGYTARAFFSWGDPVLKGSPTWLANGNNSWQDQELYAVKTTMACGFSRLRVHPAIVVCW